MREMILLKLGEIVLKGGNRRSFEEKLMHNVRRRLKPHGKFNVYTRQSTCYIEPADDSADMDGAYEAMGYVFGVAGIARSYACEKDLDAIVEGAKNYLADKLNGAKSFKVESKRSDKTFAMNSIQISQYVGGELHDAFPHLKVEMKKPELTVYVEIRDYAAFVHADPDPGAGGLPVGMGGRAVCLLSGGIDSPVAAWMMTKRGLGLEMVHFFSYPYTSDEAKEKVFELTRKLVPWCGRLTVHVVPFTKIQEEMRRVVPEDYFTLVMRRFMMRISEKVAERTGCECLITGESLGQVASQTTQAMACTGAVCTLPVFRPLIGMDKEEIIRIARKIDTFDTSILPYEDCCTVFTPRHPRTHPKLEDVVEAESGLDIDALIDEAVEGIERVYFNPWDRKDR